MMRGSFARADTFIVGNTNQTGAGSLRQAILDANATPGTNVIQFNITNLTLTITPTNALPDITNPVVMDGTTQPGFSTTPIVELNGAGAGVTTDGLRLLTSNSIIRGLVINRFLGDGLEIRAGGNTVEGCVIGLNIAGNADLGNSLNGIVISNAPGNIIGGVFSTQRNVIAGNNQSGVWIFGALAMNNLVLGNYIGLNATGTLALANSANGVLLSNAPNNTVGGALAGARNYISGNSANGVRLENTNATGNLILGNIIGLGVNETDQGNGQDGVLVINAPGNRIGGAVAGERNVISGNNSDGIELNGVSASNNVVQGNFIGPDSGGTLDRRNSANGIYLNGAASTTIGGANAGEGNLLVRNQSDGVEISGLTATNNSVLGNLIGTEDTGTTNLGNFAAGILITLNARFNFIGGTNSGAGNRIAFCASDGIWVQTGTNNAIRGNNIWSNTALGVDLDTDGITANDSGDPDTGANLRQNFPAITNVVLSTGNTLIEGTLNSRSDATFFLDFFSSFTRDATTTNGEGQVYLGSTTVTTSAGGDAFFSVNLPLTATGGRWITATATDTNGNTSEFSTAFLAVSQLPAVTFTVINTNNSGPGSLREAITANNLTFNGEPNLIAFAIPGAGPHTISPASALPAIIAPVVLDGYTQSGAASNTVANGNNAVLQIRLDAQNAGSFDGLTLAGSNSTVRGLCIVRFGGDGLELGGGGNNFLGGNFIGLDTDGATVRANAGEGIRVSNSSGNTVGGTTPAARNVISGSQSDGIEFAGAASTNNFVLGNFIGTDATGTLDRGNNGFGVNIGFDAPANTIGGTNAGARNVISGNNSGGVNVFSAGNVIQGNFIGTDVPGTQNVANNGDGIFLSVSAPGGNLIGGTNAGAGNLIAFNALSGVRISNGDSNAIRANLIHSNLALGIDLNSDFAVTANDAGDYDTGANGLQNFPLITDATVTLTNTTVQGMLNSRTNTTYQIDVFANQFADASGNGEGQQFLGGTTLTTGADSNGTFSVTLPVAAIGGKITATATDPFGNTSEFSPAFTATSLLPPQSFTVVNTNDSGPGSLRDAITTNNATANGGNNTIAFNIPGAGPHTIAPLSPLPTITRPVTIDGYTQPGAASNTLAAGFNGALKIRLDGTNITSGSPALLKFTSSSNVVRGLVLMRSFYNGVEFTTAGNALEGCIVGLDETGAARGNNTYGLFITGAGNRIGGPTPAARNVLSRNGVGVVISGPGAIGNRVEGNFIGTDLTGTTNRGNTSGGIAVDGRTNAIGGDFAGAGNVISGNGGDNLYVGGMALETRVQGNLIGLDVTGAVGLGGGVRTYFATNTLIGGTTAAARNVVLGVTIDTLSTGTRVFGNYIGTDATGAEAPVPGGGAGVTINSSYANTIGGTNAGEANVIAFANFAGVTVSFGTNNSLRGNSIYANNGLGIDLVFGNNDQPAPVITNAVANTNSTVLAGTLAGAASATFTLDFYSSPACDVSGFGEGKTWLGSGSVTTDGSGNGSFNVTLPVVIVGRVLTATATDANGNTSEFSACIAPVVNLPPVTLVVTNTNDSGPGSLREALLTVDTALATGADTIAFNIPGGGVRTIAPLSPLPSTLDPVIIDGFTQPGASANTLPEADNAVRMIQLDGVSAPQFTSGLVFTNPNNVVRGLEIKRFGLHGIELHSDGNLIAGNLICSNGNSGVFINPAANNTIGGTTPAARNILSANTNAGVHLAQPTASGNVIQGNLIGTDPAGLLNWGNGYGINLEGAVNTLVGGGGTGARNVISGNTLDGILLSSLAAAPTTNRILGNYIGTTLTGLNNLSNGLAGISILSGSGTIIGGPNAGEANRIAFNGAGGVSVSAGTNHAIRANAIFGNGGAPFTSGLGIDLGGDGVTANDLNDADTGANFRQNFPVITNAVFTTSNLLVQGFLSSRSNTAYALDFFANAAPDASAFGEGESYLGSLAVTTVNHSNAAFSLSFPLPVAGRFLSATATDPFGNTSEFGPAFKATSIVPPQTFTVVNTNDSGAGSLRAAIIAHNVAFAISNNTIAFNIPGSGVRVISPQSALPTITEPATLNGYSQPGSSLNVLSNGFDGVVLIQLDGAGAGDGGVDGLRFTSSSNVVQGLIITRFSGDGLEFVGSSNNVIAGNLIGLAGKPPPAQLLGAWGGTGPTLGTGNRMNGLNFSSAKNNYIGGLAYGTRNIVSGNGQHGANVGAGSSGAWFYRSYFGTDPKGEIGIGNRLNGIHVDQTVTGVEVEECRLAGNLGWGISVGQGTWVDRSELFGNSGGINSFAPPPNLTSAVNSGGSTTISGRAFGGPFSPLELQLAANDFYGDNPQFEQYIQEKTVVPGSGGFVDFTETITPPLRVGTKVTAISLENVLGASRISLPVEVTEAAEADVGIESITAVPDPADKGESVTFVITVKNYGGATANGVSLGEYHLAANGAYFTSLTPSQGTVETQPGALIVPPHLSWNIGSLAAGATATLTIVARSYSLGSLSAYAFVIPGSPTDSDPSNNIKIKEVMLGAPRLTQNLFGNDLTISTPLWSQPGRYEWSATLTPPTWLAVPPGLVTTDNDSIDLHVNTSLAVEGYYRWQAQPGVAPATLHADYFGGNQLKLSVDSWFAPGVFQYRPALGVTTWLDALNEVFDDGTTRWIIVNPLDSSANFYRFVGGAASPPPVFYQNNLLVLSGAAPADTTVRIDLNRDGSFDYDVQADCYGRYTVGLDASLLQAADAVTLQYFNGDLPAGGLITQTVLRDVQPDNHAAAVPAKQTVSEAAICTTCCECPPGTKTARATGTFDHSNAPRDSNGAGVELANGRVRTQVPVVSVATRKQNVEFNLIHSSLQDYNGPYGQGFSHSYNFSIVKVNPTTVNIYTPSRGPYTATSPDGGKNWVLPEGFNSTLKYDAKTAGWCLRHFSGQEYNFYGAPVGVPGYVTSICDPERNTTLFDYNGSGNLVGITSDLGQKFTLKYSRFPHLESITDPLGRTWRFVYDAAERLTQVIHPATEFANITPGTLLTDTQLPGALVTAARIVTIAYTNTAFSNQITSVTDARGAVQRAFVYDAQGRVGSAFINGKEVRYIYGPTNNPVPLTRLEATNTITRVIDREGNVTDYEIHSAGGMTAFLDGQFTTAGRFGLRRQITWTETGKGNAPLRAGEPLYWEQRWLHDCDCLAPRAVTQPFSSVEAATLAFDINQMPFFWPRTIYTYNANRQVLSESYTDGVQSNRTEYTFGGPFARLLTHKEWRAFDTNALYTGLDFTHTYEYDADGNLTRHIAPAVTRGVVSTQVVEESWTYNAFGQVLTYTDPNSNITTYAYHTGTNSGDDINTKGNFTGYLAAKTLGATGSADPAANVTESYLVNALGMVTQMTDPNGNARDYEFNALGELVRELKPAVTLRNGTTNRYEKRFVYDGAGNRVLERRSNRDYDGTPLPNVFVDRSMSYDDGNNLLAERVEVDANDANDLITRYAYDGNDDRIIVQKPEGNRSFRVYDERKLPFKEFYGVAPGASVTESFPADKRAETLGGAAFVGFTRLDYDARRNPIRTRDGRGNFTDRFYDFANRLVAESDPNTNGSVREYDDASNVLALERGVVSKINGSLLQGFARTYLRHDEMGRAYQQVQDLDLLDQERAAVDPAAGANVSLLTRLDAGSRLRTRVDANGNTSAFTYDAANRQLTEADALNNVRTLAYDPNSNLIGLSVLEVAGPGAHGPPETHVTTQVYDQLNRRTEIHARGLNGTNLDHRTAMAFDSRHNVRLVQDAENQFTLATFDDADRRTRVQQFDGDPLGGGANPLRHHEFDYDRNGRNTADRALSDVNNPASAQVTRHAYDHLDRRIRTVYPDSDDPIAGGGNGPDGVFDRVETVFDANANPVVLIEQRGVVFNHTFDVGNRLTVQSNALPASVPGTTRQEFFYDALNRVVSARNNYCRVDREYDALSRQTAEEQSIRLDGSGFVNGWEQPIRVACRFDKQSNRAGCFVTDGATTNLSVTSSFDALNRVDAISAAYFNQSNHLVADYDYFGPLRLQAKTLGHGARLTNAFDVKRRLALLLWHDPTNGLLAGFEYSNAAGNGFDRVDNARYNRLLHDGNRYDHFRYNRRYELTGLEPRSGSPTPPGAFDDSFAYDDAFNRQSASFGDAFNAVANTLDTYTDNPANEYAQVIRDGAPRNPAHDRAGNLTALPLRPVTPNPNQSDVNATSRWDAYNLLFDLETGVNPQQHYRYDPFRRRVAVLNSSTNLQNSRRFIYDGWDEVAERVFNAGATPASAPSTLERIYVQGQQVDEPILAAIDANGDGQLGGTNSKNLPLPAADQEFYFLHDGPGNTMALLDADQGGRILEYYRYNAYGEATVLGIVDADSNLWEDTPADLSDNHATGTPARVSSFSNPLLFTGRRFDAATGLHYHRNRYYDPRLGRFLSRDPLGAWHDAASAGNGYTYAGNSPFVRRDPLGLEGSGWLSSGTKWDLMYERLLKFPTCECRVPCCTRADLAQEARAIVNATYEEWKNNNTTFANPLTSKGCIRSSIDLVQAISAAVPAANQSYDSGEVGGAQDFNRLTGWTSTRTWMTLNTKCFQFELVARWALFFRHQAVLVQSKCDPACRDQIVLDTWYGESTDTCQEYAEWAGGQGEITGAKADTGLVRHGF